MYSQSSGYRHAQSCFTLIIKTHNTNFRNWIPQDPSQNHTPPARDGSILMTSCCRLCNVSPPGRNISLDMGLDSLTPLHRDPSLIDSELTLGWLPSKPGGGAQCTAFSFFALKWTFLCLHSNAMITTVAMVMTTKTAEVMAMVSHTTRAPDCAT